MFRKFLKKTPTTRAKFAPSAFTALFGLGFGVESSLVEGPRSPRLESRLNVRAPSLEQHPPAPESTGLPRATRSRGNRGAVAGGVPDLHLRLALRRLL
jgi:hypothetical protein